MDSAHTGKASWKCLHYLANFYDKHDSAQKNQRVAMKSLIGTLHETFSCKYCRNSLGPFLEEMEGQLVSSLENRTMRRFMYDLHNRVNFKLITQENDRLMKCIDQNCSTIVSDDKLEQIHHEMSCILYTKLPPTYDDFVNWPQVRDEDALWTSLSSLAHGQTLNPTAIDEKYDTLIISFIQLYWPHLVKSPQVRSKLIDILGMTTQETSYLKKVWMLRKYLFEAQKDYSKQRLREILSHHSIDLDGLRDLNLQHKSKYEESFDDFKREVVRWEVACRENTCRKTAVIQ